MIDYRERDQRWDVFSKFYDFHLKYRSHPGCVYYLMPYFADTFGWSEEEKLWFAYINGNTQNPVTSWIIFRQFNEPSVFLSSNMGEYWFNQNWPRLQWDTDRRYQKKDFVANVKWYADEVASHPGGQEGYFTYNFSHGNSHENFDALWRVVRKEWPSMGRLSAFSYLEYLKIMGVDIDCSNLFLEDMEGSKSHRNGLAIVTGRDDLDWHKVKPNYQPGDIELLGIAGANLLSQAKIRSFGKDYSKDVSYFTLESALCTYKSWHRPNRRYPNVYNDMLHDRIKWAEQRWQQEEFNWFWLARRRALPEYLRLEDNPNDPGLKPEKQNYYRENGVPVMMSRDYPEFDNEFDRKVWSREESLSL